MKLAKLSIKNFKSISSVGVELVFREGLLVLVGKNNAGKSNILEAIGILFGPKNPRYVPFAPDRFNDPTHPILIEAEFQGVTWGDGLAITLSDTQCAILTKDAKRPQHHPGALTVRLQVPPPTTKDATTDAADDDETDAKQSFDVLLANTHLVKKNEEIRQHLIKCLTVPALRSYEGLLSPSAWTAYGQLVRSILEDSGKVEDLRRLIGDATEHLRKILADEAQALTRTAKTTAYVDRISFQLTKDGNPAELLRNLTLAVTYNARTDDISETGTGTQSAVIIGVLELCLRHRTRSGIRLFLVEEPELFLHPHAQRHVAALLRSIAGERGGQVLMTTHSSSVLADTDMMDVVRVDRGNDGATRCIRLPESFNSVSAWERRLRSDNADMFFAHRAILVEGPSEAVLLPRLAKLVRDMNDRTLDPDRLSVSFIDVGGKGNFDLYTELLEAIGAEWRIVADRDALKNKTLARYKAKAGLSGAENELAQMKALRTVNVVILSQGEIEDYYPQVFLAQLAGCSTAEVPEELERRRLSFEEPAARRVVEAVLTDHFTSILTTEKQRLPKLVSAWYDQTLCRMRERGELGSVERKTGDVVARWLKKTKPQLAQEFARWIAEDTDRIPERLGNLIKWLLDGLPDCRSSGADNISDESIGGPPMPTL